MRRFLSNTFLKPNAVNIYNLHVLLDNISKSVQKSLPIILFLCIAAEVIAAEIPKNAHANMLGTGWECDRGYRRTGSECVKVQVPANAHINLLGNDWECDRGYMRAGNLCRVMTDDELRQQQAVEDAVIKKLLERRSRGGMLSWYDCEREGRSGANVCVSISNVELECNKSYDGSYYRDCEVHIDYEVSTDYEGDDYIDAEVECSAEIRYMGRDMYSWRYNSDSGDEDHDLYSYGSDSGDMVISFSFSSYEEVIRVKIDSVECEIDGVQLYE